jgi:type VI secretion system protein
MALRLRVVSRHHQSLGERGSIEFGHDGGTIGRSLESDWVLPDAQRYLSSRHASIDYRSGSYYVVDTSTNGVFVNGAEQPVGRGNPQRLFNGDRIQLGEYELSVEIEGEDNTAEHLSDRHIDPVELAQRVPPPDPTRADLVDPYEITGVGIEMLLSEEAEASALRIVAERAVANLRLEDDPPRAQRPAASAAPSRGKTEPPPVSAAKRVAPKARVAPPPAVPSPTPPQPKPAAAAPSAVQQGAEAPNGPAATLDAFFRGAGLPAPKLDEKQADRLMHGLGQVMRELIVGISENLHMRTEHKNALRLPNTTIQPRANNPLKFSAGVEEALTNLLLRESSEYLPPVEAVREAFSDLKQHQQSLLASLRAAVADYVSRLDPDELESKYTSGKRGGLMSAANKLKYWDLYKDLYQLVTQAEPGQLPQQFLEEMARAYEQTANRDSRAAQAKAG